MPYRSFFVVCLLGSGIGCSGDSPAPPRQIAPETTTATATGHESPPTAILLEKDWHDWPGLHNVYRLTPTLLSGSSPEGAAGFDSLAQLGVKTILSVDGAVPDVAVAQARGMRYVHLPVGYDGISPLQGARLAAAIRDLPGPIYVHCHHGKHRGPAAAMAALRANQPQCPLPQAVAFLKSAGTDPRYAGLYAAVESPPTLPNQPGTDADYPPRATIPDAVEAMVNLDDHWSALQAALSNHAADAPISAMMATRSLEFLESVREYARLPDIESRPAEFQRHLAQLTQHATALDAALNGASSPGNPPVPSAAANRPNATTIAAALTQIRSDCTACHRQFRDNRPNPESSR
ncbi:hypothetical protein [Tuwongella immobilis]|uniref:Protein tyrosine serine phosphatase: Uncharacterized protein n=1 Tax=Tuwongella immobilis TaxID=692036 RepID=A0A6C2YL14_9BACT|nr:hypothetical protein [Tuwongella immobilis]VIP01919.1 protein tyrosine serine phosphatase : Uncharacterized protein OS=Singulisphaera acidiphila (strain ATCC BAA-1392 / DSM 18658 / VKM B-2454 / MOB10) GN=Sinac_4453 PE=4 SV=1 [Tuwongella immobilis]VTR99845.1 protein tyrosine serine phosphatase : Uncharacterized protein OS=Singulisphaera acidiphila (strain ATCC BAA-1392 / DSM 18658 / VKM B-2454 / MOB10) GN=Sinac_4453 PE=4 SV=1 [Tuwongella immobilis]